MEKERRKPVLLIAGGLLLVLALGAAAMLAAGAAVVFAQTTDTPEASGVEQVPAVPSERGFVHPFGRGGHSSLPEEISSYNELLAEALGVDLETLQDAYTEVQAALLDEAVAAGLLTEEQAAAMLQRGFDVHGRGSFGFHGFESRGFSLAGKESSFDHEAALAEALGVSTTELQEARESSRAAALAELVEAELLTQEKAEFMLAAEAFERSVDRDALVAEALGVSVQDLEAAREADKSLATLIEELGLTTAEARDAIQAAHEAAVQQAVSDGILTPEQGEQLLNGGGAGSGPCGRGHSGRGGFHGHNFHHGGRSPGGAGEDANNPFRTPGRGTTSPFAGFDA